jgi:hypothetical protein
VPEYPGFAILLHDEDRGKYMPDRERPLATEHMIARGRQLRQDMTFPERLL